MQRFWDKVRIGPRNECWEWLAYKQYKGYGIFGFNGNPKLAHRVSYQLSIGTIPEGMCICHHCDNPSCVNPAHLFLGTNADNTADRDAKGRHVALKGENNGRAKLTDADVLAIRDSGLSQNEIAAEYGVSQTVVSNIKIRKSWKHI